MIFLLSGEGPTDIGKSSAFNEVCSGQEFLPGPMAIFIDQVVSKKLEYSILELPDAIRFVSETSLNKECKKLGTSRSIDLPGTKKKKETQYFYNNARSLARIAKRIAAESDCDVVAVLFRDADGPANQGRGIWKEKRQSIHNGFNAESHTRRVAMIPLPKSEAWLICALKKQPYQHCDKYEARSGNDESENSLKSELETLLGCKPTRESIVAEFKKQNVQAEKIQMQSFLAFVEDLMKALEDLP